MSGAVQRVQDGEQSLVRRLLDEGWSGLGFPPDLESDFRSWHRMEAIVATRKFLVAIVGFYLLAGILTCALVWRISPASSMAHDLTLWLSGFWAGVVCLTMVLVASTRESLHPHYVRILVLACGLGIMAAQAVEWRYEDASIARLANYVTMMVILAVYGLSRLWLLPAILVVSVATALSLLAGLLLACLPSIMDFVPYYGMTNLFGILLCWLMEYRDRVLFLQRRLLELEKHEIDEISSRLDQISRIDALTGLSNRRHFNDVFQREWERARREGEPLTLLFIDVDCFKAYNDKYGHLAGDRCLSAVGQVLRNGLKRSGDVAARYGGEEFVVMLPNTPQEGGARVATALLEAVDALQIEHAASLASEVITISVGVASVVPAQGSGSLSLVDAADRAVYRAKQAGRHRVEIEGVVTESAAE